VTQPEICVAHLVRRANDLSAVQTFLESYRRNAAGVPHDLLIIFKGFPGREQLAPYDELLADLPHKRLFVRDFGYDVRPYLKAAHEHAHRHFVFLNSFSRVMVPGWLEMMHRCAVRPGVGVVGATGSHQSILTDYHFLKWQIRKTWPAYMRPLVQLRRYLRYVVSIRSHFLPFPNYHVRTNAFMIAGDVLRRLRTKPFLRKWDAYHFESGIHSMTQQVLRGGLSAVVVGADGRGYAPRDWPDARTFWISQQENLLVSDNQTRAYDQGSENLRERLAFHAWRRAPDGSPRVEAPVAADAVSLVAKCPQCTGQSRLLFTVSRYRCRSCRFVFPSSS
jgi:hypothetical protein